MVKKTTIKSGDQEKKVPSKYVPKGLSAADKKKQVKSIIEKKDRPKVDSVKSKRSSHVIKFEKKYGKKITDKKWINDNLLKSAGQEEILKKGRGAYYSSGSRPNVSASAWAYARLASALTAGKAKKVDKAIFDKYKVSRK